MTIVRSYRTLINLLVALSLVLSAAATSLTPHTAYSADIYPDCNWNCTANDVTVTRTWLGYANGTELGPCTRGGNVTAYVWAEFYNNTASNRYAIWAIFDLWVNGTLEASTVQCELDTIPPGTQSAMIWGPITWVCGHQVTVQHLNLSWLGTPAT